MTSSSARHVRHGIGSVRPYVYGYPELVELVKQAFGGEVLEHADAPGGAHVELKVGDSVLVLETGNEEPAGATRASIYVYVPDVDEAYRRAVALGARPLSPPQDKPYRERAAGVTDRFGNTWFLATYRE